MGHELVARLVLGLVSSIGMGVLTWLAYKLSSARWWPSLLFQLTQRPRLVSKWVWGTLAVALIVGSLALDVPGCEAAFIIWLIFAPVLITGRVDRAAWCEDVGGDLRSRAAAVRNRAQQRTGEPEIGATKPWRGYVIDAAKAERISAYQARFEG